MSKHPTGVLFEVEVCEAVMACSAKLGLLGAGGGLRGPRGGGTVPLTAARSGEPSAFDVGGAIVAPTFATGSTSPVRAVFLGLVPTILAGGGAAGGVGASDYSAAVVEEIRVLENHGLIQVSRRVLSLLMMLRPQLHTAAAACVVEQIIVRHRGTISTAAADARCRREKRDHANSEADGIGGVERMRVEIDRGCGGLRVVVLERRRRLYEELRWKAAIDVGPSGSGGRTGAGGSASSGGASIET